MLNLQNTKKENLQAIALCHMECFPDSLATKLGVAYVKKTFDWYLDQPKKFLFHIELNGKVIGYCGGFVPSKPGDGSSSGMLQHAFSEAIRGLLLHPWLLFHAEVKPHYPFLWRNIKRKVTGRMTPAKPANNIAVPFTTYCGLVVIGVSPSHRGQGIAKQLMDEFEKRAVSLNQTDLKLSVKRNNSSALSAYKKNGWYVGEEHPVTFVMHKTIGGELR